MRSANKSFKLILRGLSLLGILAACTTARIQDKGEATTSQQVAHVAQEVPVVYYSIKEITNKSDLILIGQVIEAKEILNTARDPADPTKPDAKYFSIGQVYTVQVEECLKGDGPKTLHIIQHRGFLVLEGEKIPGAAELEKAQKESGVEPLDLHRKYLMFLRASAHVYQGYEGESLYVGVAHPWLFIFADSNCVQVEDSIEALSSYFPPQPYATLYTQIEAAIAGREPADEAVYPPPFDNQLCPADGSQPYP